jgi:hypothetical protein
MTDQTDTPQTDAPDAQPVDQTPPPAAREPREIVPFEAGGALQAMIPQTPQEYARMAGLLIDAGMIPASYDSKATGEQWLREVRAKLIIGLMKSVEIGVPPITGMNGIMIINNRPSVWGDLAAALIHRSGQLARMEVFQIGKEPMPGTALSQWDAGFGYRVSMWRRGSETAFVGEFTVADARRAGLWENAKKAPWIYYPKDMLFNRARAKAQARGFSDCLHGMGIAEVERDIAPELEAPSTKSLLDDEPEVTEDAVFEPVEGGEQEQGE